MDKIVSGLIERTKHLYGNPGAQIADGQFSFRNEIVEKKINDIIANIPTVWSSMAVEVKEKYPNVIDRAFTQFPNFSFIIVIKEKREDEKIELRRTFHFVLSLLTNYYTYYFEDSYSLEEFAVDQILAPTISTLSCGALCKKHSAYQELVDFVQALVAKYYPDYHYIHHHVLFDVKVDLPIVLPNAYLGPPYPLFSYLFDDRVLTGDHIVWM